MDNYFDDPCVNLDDDKDMSNDVDSSDSGDSGSEPTTNNETNEPLMMDVGGEVFKRVTDLTADDILVLQFGSQKEAYVFYSEYAKAHGFVVRKDEVKKDVRGNIVMRQFKGGYSNLGFSRKDVYNYIDKFRANRKGKLKHLFWADGVSISDYHCFGDVMAFDTTYRKNKYNCPLVIFSGCDHHSQTTIFLCALVADEIMETYKWVLEAFMIAMGNKHPKAVVTDGDGAMREAIKQVFPNACHRLCAWHLHNNACENVKCGPFLEDFKTAMYSNFTKDEFEEFWKKMVAKHGLEENKWVCKTYDNKIMWATTYLRDKFFGRIRTMSQCEAINSMVKTYVKKSSTIIEFIHNFEEALRGYRNNELSADFKSLFSEPVMTTCLQKIERQASKIYTMEMFKEVRDEIDKAGALNVTERTTNNEKLRFKLSSLVLKRWTKTTKSHLISSYSVGGVSNDVLDVARLSALTAYANNFVKVAYEKTRCFDEIVDDIFNLQLKYEKKGDPSSACYSSAKKISDPSVVKTKESSGYDITHDNDKSETGFDACNNQDPQHSQQLSGNNIKKIKPKNYSGGGIPNIPQGIPMMPHYVGGSFNPQTSQVPIFSQPPQYYAPIPNVNNGTSWNDLLQHVMHNRGASSSSNNMKTS
ncbi:MULE transposase domain [Sesbania bispinosa]|nr:MULE transposase domain [Sesbania bispinosa]